MPIFRPNMPEGAILLLKTLGDEFSRQQPRSILELNLDVHAGRQVEPHQSVHGSRARLLYVDQPSVSADLKLLLRVLVDVRRADDAEFANVSRQWYRARDRRSCPLRSLHDLARRPLNYTIIQGSELYEG